MTYKDSAPCSRCANIMKILNIKNIIYSNSEGKLIKCRVKDYNTNHISQGNRFLNRGMKHREEIKSQ